MRSVWLLFFSSIITQYCFAQNNGDKDSTNQGNVGFIQLPATDIVKAYFSIYPNPAKNKITLQVTGFAPGITVVKITDTKGKVWRADNRLLINGTEEVTIFLMLPTGIYFIELNQPKKMARKKLVII